MKNLFYSIVAGTMFALAATAAVAGPERIDFFGWLETDFVFLTRLDKPGNKPPIARLIYINRDAFEAARAGRGLPYGTKIVMAEQLVRTDDRGQALRDENGALLPMQQLSRIMLSEKRQGWGSIYPTALRNGDWEYAVLSPEGKLVPETNYDKCRECHLNAAANDYTFSVFRNLSKAPR